MRKMNIFTKNQPKAFVIIFVCIFFLLHANFIFSIQGADNSLQHSSPPILSSTLTYALVTLHEPSSIDLLGHSSFSAQHHYVKSYQQYLQQRQRNLFSQINSSIIEIELIGFLQHTLNGFIVLTREYHLPFIEQFSGIKSCIALPELFDTERWTTALTIKSITSFQEESQPWTGKGTRVGIIDTGVDYLHQDFYPPGIRTKDSKTVDGDDFADNEYKDDQLVKDDKDPMDDGIQYRGHGTHVAGIATGNNPDIPVARGIAPDASLLAYKVFSSKPNARSASGAHIIQAVEKSIEDECTVINLSLGHRGRPRSEYDDSPYYSVFENAVKAGVIVVATAGNNGSRFLEDEFDNQWPMSAPGTFESVIQVAATDDRHFYPISIELNDGRSASINALHSIFTPVMPEFYSMLDIVDAGFGSKEEIENLDLEGKIALISRGPREKGISFLEKNQNAKNAGALACVIYNYDPVPLISNFIFDGDESDPWALDFIPTISISSIGGEWMKELIEIGGRMSFSPSIPVSMADYTSAGPSPDALLNHFKPDLSAPGTSIYSTLPSVMSTEEMTIKWGNRQGTSMAAPVVTGSIALLKEAFPWLSPIQAKALLMNTSDILINPINNEVFSFLYQGAGQINIESALSSPVIATPPALMKDLSTLNESFMLEIENFSNETVYIDLRSVVYQKYLIYENIIISMDKPFLHLKPNEIETVQLWFHREDIGKLPRKIEGVIWLDVFAPMSQGVMTHNLHVPFILYNSSTILDIESPVSNVILSKQTLSAADEQSLDVSFDLNSGTQIRSIDNEENHTISVRNYASRFAVYISNENGKIMDTIFYAEYLPVGRYQFEWNGFNINNYWFLEDGSYELVFAVHMLYRNQVTEEQYIDLLPVSSHSIEITNSPLSIPKELVLSFPRIMARNQQYTANLYCLEAHDVVTSTTYLTFPDSWKNIQIFSTNDNFEMNYQWHISASGKNYLELNGLKRLYLDKPHWHIASISFSLHEGKEGEVPDIESHLMDPFELERKVNYHVHSWVYPQNSVKILDFNKDGIMDKQDKDLFFKHYGLTYHDSAWDPKYDLNGNWKISLEDLIIFSTYYYVE